MPTYEYVCQSCGTHVEVYQRFSEDPLTECGVCGGPLRKVFHPAGILFKGSGFYVTDSRAGRKGKDDKAASGSKGGRGEAKAPEAGSKTGSTSEGGSGSSDSSSSSSTGSSGRSKEASA